MYPNINPHIRVEETINDPISPDRVLGFRGRATRVGEQAILVKESALEPGYYGDDICLTLDLVDEITANGMCLYVLHSDETTLSAMDCEALRQNTRVREVKGRGKSVTVAAVGLDNDSFREFQDFEVSN